MKYLYVLAALLFSVTSFACPQHQSVVSEEAPQDEAASDEKSRDGKV